MKVTPHRFLNSSKGIVRDRARVLSDMTEDQLCKALASEGVTNVKRFTFKDGDTIRPSNTYLMEFSSAVLPSSIKTGFCRMAVELYVPNPLRCYKCQKFGHGSRACRGHLICYVCGSDEHESFDCERQPKCANCKGSHKADSKQCPSYIREAAIIKLKYKNNISFAEARKRYSANDRPSYAVTLSASATPKPKPVSVNSVACQTEYTWLTQSYPTHIIVKPPSSSPSATASTQTATQPKSKSQPASQSQTPQLPAPASPSSSRTGRKSKNKKNNSGKALTRDKSPVQTNNRFESLMEDSQGYGQSTSRSPSRQRSSSHDPGGRKISHLPEAPP